jgi:diguanylate cyclase (GGDEF)-like protein
VGVDDFDEDSTVQVDEEVARRVARGRGRAALVVITGTSVGKIHKLFTKLTTIGRSNLANVQLDEEGVSRRHAQIVQEGDRVLLRDLGSKNGTFVNGERVSERALQEGDKIVLGAAVIRFTLSDALDVKFHEEMYEAALVDALTRLHNRKYFFDRLGQEAAYAQRHRTPLSLILLDVDRFKDVNDRYGHPAGDKALAKVAALISSTVRQEDVVARYGGEEFVVLCRGVDLAGAEVLAGRICRLVAAQPFDHDGRTFPITLSAGVAALAVEAVGETLNGSGPDELIAMADEALYEAKRSGRDRVVARRRATR